MIGSLKYLKAIIKSKYFLLLVASICFQKNISAQQYWQSLGYEFNRFICCFYADTIDDFLYVGGDFSEIDSLRFMGVAKWNGTDFNKMGCGVDWDCYSSMCTYPQPVLAITRYNNEIYAAGKFKIVDSLLANGIAKWNGLQWDTLQGGVTFTIGYGGIVWDLLSQDNELYVCGQFDQAGAIQAKNIAKWNGATWTDVGDFNYTSSILYSLAYYKGKLYVAGLIQDSLGIPFNIACWDGIKWEAVGGGIKGTGSLVYSLCVYKDELYVGGNFNINDGNYGNYIQKWDGVIWTSVGGGVSSIYGNDVPVRGFQMSNDELWVIGDFDFAGGIYSKYIAKWNGVDWCNFGSIFFRPAITITSFRNEIYLGSNYFEIDSVIMPGFIKWTGGSYVDTCGNSSGIQQQQINETTCRIFPNPASDHITISYPGKLKQDAVIEIINTLGQQQSTVSSEQSAVEGQQSAVSNQQSAVSQQSEVSSQQSAINSQQSAVSSQQSAVNGKIELDVSGLPAGLYFVIIRNDGQLISGKFVK